MELEFNHIEGSQKGKTLYYMKKLIRDSEIYKQYINSNFNKNKNKNNNKQTIRKFRYKKEGI